MAVDSEGGEPFLGMGGEHGSQIHGAGPLRAVEAPDRLDGIAVHVHGFRTVTPAGGHRQRDGDAFPAEFLLAGGRLGHAADRGIGDDYPDGFAV